MATIVSIENIFLWEVVSKLNLTICILMWRWLLGSSSLSVNSIVNIFYFYLYEKVFLNAYLIFFVSNKHKKINKCEKFDLHQNNISYLLAIKRQTEFTNKKIKNSNETKFPSSKIIKFNRAFNHLYWIIRKLATK